MQERTIKTMEMTKAFYIIQTDEDWYRLHVTSTHYCLGGCDNTESLLNTVMRLTKRYRNEQKLLKGLSKLNDGGHVNEKTFEVYDKEYNNSDYHFEKEVSDTVKKALEEVKFDTPYHRALKRTFNRKKTLITDIDSGCTKEETPIAPVARKPRLKKW